MDIAAFLKWIEASSLATRIRDSFFLFPLLESAHVLGLALVFGTIAIIDLRLLGLASTQRSFTRMASDILKWTWAAFALTALTGALMFTTNAGVYYHNFFFRTKMLLLVLAGLNMLVFELTAGRTIHRWDKAPSAPSRGQGSGSRVDRPVDRRYFHGPYHRLHNHPRRGRGAPTGQRQLRRLSGRSPRTPAQRQTNYSRTPQVNRAAGPLRRVPVFQTQAPDPRKFTSVVGRQRGSATQSRSRNQEVEGADTDSAPLEVKPYASRFLCSVPVEGNLLESFQHPGKKFTATRACNS